MYESGTYIEIIQAASLESHRKMWRVNIS